MAVIHGSACCDSGLDESVEHAFFHYRQVHVPYKNVKEMTARINPKQFDALYIVKNIDPPRIGAKWNMFLAILTVL